MVSYKKLKIWKNHLLAKFNARNYEAKISSYLFLVTAKF